MEWLSGEFAATGVASTNPGSPGGGTGRKPGGPPVKSPRIVHVRTSRGMIQATIAGSHLVCGLSRWNGRRWQPTRVGPCRTSVTYRHLTAGRYRLTVVSRKASATKVVILRRGVSRR
jgi:hypothetical protein